MDYIRVSMEEYDAEVNRRIRRRRLRHVMDAIEALAAMTSIIGLAAAWMLLTPAQRGAEADIAAEQMEGGAR